MLLEGNPAQFPTMSRLEMAVFACCLSAVGAGLAFFPMYYVIRFFRRQRRQSRSFLEVIGKASGAPAASGRLLIEHPPLIIAASEPSFNPPRGREAESSRVRAA